MVNMSDVMTLEQVREELRSMLACWGEQKQLALQMGVSPSFLNGILQGRKVPSDKILDHLGLERVVLYRRTKRKSTRVRRISR